MGVLPTPMLVNTLADSRTKCSGNSNSNSKWLKPKAKPRLFVRIDDAVAQRQMDERSGGCGDQLFFDLSLVVNDVTMVLALIDPARVTHEAA